MSEYLRQTLAHYREQRQKIMEQQLRPVEVMIRRIEADLGEASEEPGALDLPPLPLTTLTPEHNGDHKPAGNGKRPDIRADEFFSLTQGEAARKYLNMVGHAVSVDELLDVLRRGGCPV